MARTLKPSPNDTAAPDYTEPTRQIEPGKVAQRPGRLCLRIGGGEPWEVELLPGIPVTFGRSRMADVVIRDDSLSKIHFALRAHEDGVELEDLGSKNGTRFADRSIRRIEIEPGDSFMAGGCRIELLAVDAVDVEVSLRSECGLLVGSSVVMRELFAMIEKLAPTPLDVLVLGDTGTGKELTARTLHDLSPRRAKPFVVLDCSSLPSTLADAALFGFRRGAFTGAEYDQPGLFEQAHGGTLFIDELGELPADLQAKFLRALDRRQVSRLGEPGNVRSFDVRVVAATNRKLADEVRAHRFREDLFHRISQSTIHLPCLRERGDDVLVLTDMFLLELRREHGIEVALGDDTRALMLAHDWPGNVRELRNAVRRAAFVCRDGKIRFEDLALGREPPWLQKIADSLAQAETYDRLHEVVDRVVLPTVLRECGSISATAKRLAIGRERLRARMRALGLYDVGED
jgi:DNA-binding NtrC family response regulator